MIAGRNGVSNILIGKQFGGQWTGLWWGSAGPVKIIQRTVLYWAEKRGPRNAVKLTGPVCTLHST